MSAMRIRDGILILLALGPLGGPLGPTHIHPAPPPAYDLVIRGGTIVDGSGKPGFNADLAIRGGRIVKLGRIEAPVARTSFDAVGMVVAPGFVDAHNHTEFALADTTKRFNEGFLRQGVTTIVGGPDGTVSPDQISRLSEIYQKNGIATNVAFYVGHNAIRFLVMGGERRAPTGTELAAMKRLVREGMELGAVGLSTALMYDPGRHSKTEELVELAREAARYRGIYDSHVRNPGHAHLESDQEAIEIGERAGIPVKIANEGIFGLENRGLGPRVIRLIESARARGVKVVTDQYPYDGSWTANLEEIILVPAELRGPVGFNLIAALRDPALSSRLQQASEDGVDGGFSWLKAGGYSQFRITTSKDYPEYVGKYLSELALDRGLSGFDLVRELMTGATSPVGITLAGSDEEDVRRILTQSWNMIASDGIYSDGITPRGHPRSTGTFPKVLGYYVREHGLLTLAEAVRKMTSLPADFLGLYDRGRIAEGKAADLVIFDPRTISDLSTWEQPQRYGKGVNHVVVNGSMVLQGGKLTGRTPGKLLKRQR